MPHREQSHRSAMQLISTALYLYRPRWLDATCYAQPIMRILGNIAGLRVQTASLKVGEQGRRYDPGALRAVAALTLDDGGVTGWTAEGVRVDDVHQRDHPRTKYRGENGISVGFSAHYATMRAHFGEHLIDGIAGENILVNSSRMIGLEDLSHGLLIRRGGALVARLHEIVVAEPCLPFSRYALGGADDEQSVPTVKAALTFLREGCRGYYAGYLGAPAIIQVGDEVLLP